MEDDDAWISCHKDDLWIFDKCFLSTKLGYNCGPADVDVSEAGIYIVTVSYTHLRAHET